MWRLTRSPECYDVWEKALYNTVLACLGRDGQRFFYVNPLAVDPEILRENPALQHVQPSRRRWFGVACCPPNMARCVLSIGRSVYAASEGTLYVLSHIDSELTLPGLRVTLAHDRDDCRLTVDAPATDLLLRIPEGFDFHADQGEARDGYWRIAHGGGPATYTYRLTAKVRVLRAHPRIAQDAGKLCVTYGQRVYCLEQIDNGPALCELGLPADARFEILSMDWLPEGVRALRTRGIRLREEGWTRAYMEKEPEAEPATLTFVPYSQWNNRGEGEMRVWVNEAR
jgi:DUF1680 family protein